MPHEITEFAESFIIRDTSGRGIAAVYFDDGDAVRRAARERFAHRTNTPLDNRQYTCAHV